MIRHFHHDLEALRDRLSEMAGRAETALTKSVEAVRMRDARLAEAIFGEDLEIDRIEIEIEERCLSFLGLQQPVARDLRFLVAAIRIATDLERVGDHAVNIAQGAKKLAAFPAFKLPPDIPRMGDLAISMLRESVSAWLAGDAVLAKEVCARDVEVDSYKAQVFAQLSSKMIRDPDSVPRALQYLLVSRNLERVADLATNIAEEAIFVAEARVIKHHAEEHAAGGASGSESDER